MYAGVQTITENKNRNSPTSIITPRLILFCTLHLYLIRYLNKCEINGKMIAKCGQLKTKQNQKLNEENKKHNSPGQVRQVQPCTRLQQTILLLGLPE